MHISLSSSLATLQLLKSTLFHSFLACSLYRVVAFLLHDSKFMQETFKSLLKHFCFWGCFFPVFQHYISLTDLITLVIWLYCLPQQPFVSWGQETASLIFVFSAEMCESLTLTLIFGPNMLFGFDFRQRKADGPFCILLEESMIYALISAPITPYVTITINQHSYGSTTNKA